jgi:hypothetical protein
MPWTREVVQPVSLAILSIMLGAFLLAVALPNLVPARWASADPKTLDLLRDSPVNCLLLEQNLWSAAFIAKAHDRDIAVFGVVHPDGNPMSAVHRASAMSLDGVAMEGAFEPAAIARLRAFLADARVPVVVLGLRSQMQFTGGDAIVGTFQGLWPGIEAGQIVATPSATPWIDTNTGFLRFARAASEAAVWIANRPPAGQTFPAHRYVQAIGDAEITGARWVVSLDEDFTRRLLAGDPHALDGWRTINQALGFYEAHRDWRSAQAFGDLALVEDRDSGALLSGGVLDMIAVKHASVRPIPAGRMTEAEIAPSTLAVNVDPQSLDDHQKDILKEFTRAGGTLLSGPPGWRFPQPRKDEITLEKNDLQKLDEIWRELNSFIGRRNLGARLFNVSSMLSNLLETPDRKEVVLHLVNYSDYPVENVTAHVLGAYSSATLYRPGQPPVALKGYETDEGTGYDIDRVGYLATLVLRK